MSQPSSSNEIKTPQPKRRIGELSTNGLGLGLTLPYECDVTPPIAERIADVATTKARVQSFFFTEDLRDGGRDSSGSIGTILAIFTFRFDLLANHII